MLRTYSQDELIDLWMVLEGLAASPGVSGVSDQTLLRRFIALKIDEWYSELLRTAPSALLPTEDIAQECQAVLMTANCAVISTPGRLIRPLNLKMEDWEYSVTEFLPSTSQRAIQWHRTALAPSPYNPAACVTPDGDIHAHGLSRTPSWSQIYFPSLRGKPGLKHPNITSFTGVIRPDDVYIFDDSLLEPITSKTL